MRAIGVHRGRAEAFRQAAGDDTAERSPQAETEIVDWSAAAAEVTERCTTRTRAYSRREKRYDERTSKYCNPLALRH